ncbi:hypothetical protein D3C72_1610780 [compost metagenome]
MPTVKKNRMMIGTMPLMNGEGITEPVLGSRSGAASGTTSAAIIAINTSAAMPLIISPWFCNGVSASILSSALPRHSGNLGSINLSVSSAPAMVSTITEVAIKYQLSITLT